MFSKSADVQLGWVLGLVFAIIAGLIALTLVVAVDRGGVAGAWPAAQAPQPSAPTLPALLVPAPAAPSGAAVSKPTALSAQAMSDAASITVDFGVVKFYFASGKAELAAGAGAALVDVVKGAKSGKKVIISGFHDARGNAAFNDELARQRALAVRDALKAAGVADSQIRLEKTEQIAGTGSDAEARRVEIVLQ